MWRHRTLALLGTALLFWAGTCSADTIKLDGGGTVQGQILDDKSTKDSLVIKLERGGEVTVERAKIQAIVRGKSGAAEYEEIKGTYGDTAEEQFKLAQWCEQNKLYRQRREHLEKVIELDPDHKQAREKLGYVKLEGKWLTPQEQKEAKGLVRFGGRYVTPQEKEILEQKKREDEAVREWHQKILMWKKWLVGNDPAKARQGEERLRAIKEPQALDAVVGQFGKDKSEPMRLLMCDILNNLPGERATLELVKRCIIDVSVNVRFAAADKLVEREDPAAVRMLINILSSEHTAVVRRAAEALGALGSPSAVPALINVLVTKEKQLVTRGGGPNFGTSTPYVADYEVVTAPNAIAFKPIIRMEANGVGLSAPQQEIVVVPIENPEVLEALRSITKEDFGFNQATWRQWYAVQLRKEEAKKRLPLD
ncbi:MAG: HEAT repeat domain-containing protein [Planctomycetes bacterium]|nr:HEAT repeat domain-containing protein [Planctomycetota bacterium]